VVAHVDLVERIKHDEVGGGTEHSFAIDALSRRRLIVPDTIGKLHGHHCIATYSSPHLNMPRGGIIGSKPFPASQVHAVEP
jgi:hypothetical protein